MEEFTRGELQLMFQRIDEKLTELNTNISRQFARYDDEIRQLKTEVEELRSFQTKAMTMWAVIVAALSFALNKFL